MHIWQILDGKPGHENQTRGLCMALQRINPQKKITLHEIVAAKTLSSYLQWASSHFPQGRSLPKPQLIIGAGHRTHAAILAAKRCFGGKSIVLMKPSLPTALFDLCIVPKHDNIAASDRVILTEGVLNTIQTQQQKPNDRTLILIGGPASHVTWDDERILKQIESITADTHRTYILSTSRRTPKSFIQAINRTQQAQVEIHLAENTPQGWLAGQLNQCSEAWVSADSVSMVYESLTAGVAVGIIELRTDENSRVIRGLNALNRENSVTLFSGWQHGRRLPAPKVIFNEAERCARWISDHLFNEKTS